MLRYARQACSQVIRTVSRSYVASSSSELKKDIYAKIGNALGGESGSLANLAEQPKPAIKPSVPARYTPKGNQHVVLDIPPQEDPLLSLLTSCLMQGGQRHKASKRVSGLLLHLHAFTRAPPLPLFREAVFAVAPALRLVHFRVSAKGYIQPMAISERRRMRTALLWIIAASKARTGETIEERIAREMVAIVNGEETPAVRQKMETHKTAMQNRGTAMGRRV